MDITGQGNKNQIDYVLIDKRFRNGIQNSKSMPGADCESDHNPVIVTMKIRLQRVRKSKKTVKWSINNLKKPEIKHAFRTRLNKHLQDENIDEGMEIGAIWNNLNE